MPALPDPPVTAVVVVHHPLPVTTQRCLSSLTASEGVDLHLVVACNGDQDAMAVCTELAAAAGARLVRCSSNRGFAAAVNEAVDEVPADHHVFLLNDDAWVRPDTVRRCTDALAAAPPECVSVAPLVLQAHRPDLVDSLGVVVRANGEAFNAHIGADAACAGDGRECLGPCFAAALLRAGSLGRDGSVGPLDERYFLYYEDVDWNVRARHRGFTSVVEPAAVVYHEHALSTSRLGERRRYELVQRNLLVFATTNLSRRAACRVWADRLVTHAKGVVTGPHRRPRLFALAAAARRVPRSVLSRRAVRGDSPAADETLFSFASGLSPVYDTPPRPA